MGALRSPEDFVGAYGTSPRWGVISEHVPDFVRAGGIVRGSASGSAAWAMVGATAYPVMCSELVEIQTEDGRVSGRCGLVATVGGSCAGHAEEIDAWRALTESERAFIERTRDAG